MATSIGVSESSDAASTYYMSVATIASHWACSADTASRRIEKYRGQSGFLDLGSAGDLRRHKRRYAIVRISRELLKKIENDMRMQ